jgi:hypothetical protein
MLFVLSLLVFVWSGGALFGDTTWFFHDLKHHHLPWRWWVSGAWASGHLPLWAPVAHGYPLMADGQAGILYPVNILLSLVFSKIMAFNISVIIHHLAAVWGGYALARVLGRSQRSSMLAGIIYGFSGLLITHLVYLGMFQVIALTPLMIAASLRGVRESSRWFLVSGLLTGFAWLAGHPQMALYATYAMVFITLWHASFDLRGHNRPFLQSINKKRVKRAVVGILVTGLISIGIALPQLMASYELSTFGLRDGGVTDTFAAVGGLPIEEIFNGFFHSPFGYERAADIPITYHHRADLYLGRGISYLENAFFVGVLTLPLLLLGITTRRARGWLVLCIIGFIVMLGASTPFYGLFRMLPGMDFFRFPVRASLWVVLAMSQLAAIGMDRLTDSIHTKPKKVITIAQRAMFGVMLGVIAATMLAFGLEAIGPNILEALTGFFTRPAPSAEIIAEMTAAGVPIPEARDAVAAAAKAEALFAEIMADVSPWSARLLFPICMLMLAITAVRLTAQGRLDLQAPGFAITTLLLLDLIIYGGSFNPQTPVEVVTKRPEAALSMLGEPGLFRATVFDRRVSTELDTELLSSNMGLIFGFEDVIIPSPLRTERNGRYIAATGLDLSIEGQDEQLAKLTKNRHLTNLSGVRYLFTTNDALELPDTTVVYNAPHTLDNKEQVNIRVIRNDKALKRAFVVGCTIRADRATEFDALLANKQPSVRAVVSDGLGLESCVTEQVGTTTVKRTGVSGLEIKANMDAPGWLVITESRYPGQMVTVDGTVRGTTPTNYLFQGLPLTAGAHTITFEYRPMSILYGMALSWLLILLITLVMVFPIKPVEEL